MPRLFRDLAIARGDGSYERLLKSYARIDVLGLDDWGLAQISAPERRDLLEIREDRYTQELDGRRAAKSAARMQNADRF